MQIHLGIEDIEPGNWVAWIFEFPGCYARASVREEAVNLAPSAVDELFARLGKSGAAPGNLRPSFDIVIAEEFRAFHSSPDYIVNAFFDDDRLPLTEGDIEYARRILDLNRSELMSISSKLSDNDLDRVIVGEIQGSIRGILRHIGTAEWWYWDRLGLAFPRAERPERLFELLSTVREFTLRRLPELVGSTRTTICSGEEWSPRKLLRRTIWHERVHTLQITRYLQSRQPDRE